MTNHKDYHKDHTELVNTIIILEERIINLNKTNMHLRNIIGIHKLMNAIMPPKEKDWLRKAGIRW